jgi:hypothetical protein
MPFSVWAKWFSMVMSVRISKFRRPLIEIMGLMVLLFFIFRHYPQILQVLSQLVGTEKHAGTLDNICGALARLIITNSMLVPMKEVRIWQ